MHVRSHARWLLAVALIGCSGASPSGSTAPPAGPTPSAATSPTATSGQPTPAAPTASPVDQPTTAPTLPATPAPSATESLEKGEASVLAYATSGGVDYEIVQMVMNTGDGWVRLATGASTFTIFNADGAPLEFQDLSSMVQIEDATPMRLAPGGSAYLMCNYFSDDFPLSDYRTAESDVVTEPVGGPADASLVVADASTKVGIWFGLDVIGTLTNPGSAPVSRASVGALFFDADGAVLGFTSGLVQDIAPGATPFEIKGTFQFDFGKIADTRFFAEPWDF